MTANPFQKATRAQLKARVAFAGPTGAGKTWTALEWATVLANGGRVAVVDTERGSASLYSDRFDFDVMAFDPPYDPQRLADILKAAEANGYAVVLVDSLSHFWEGEGGTRDIADAAAARSGGNTFAGWKDATPKLRHLIDVMLGLDAHLVATMRSKMEYVLEANDRGKQTPRKVGMAPVMRAGVEYEFTLVGDIDLDHRIAITKSRCDRLADELVQPGRADEAAKTFADWLGEGEPLATRPEVDALVARMNALPDSSRKECKQAFAAEIGRPDSLRASQLDAADALVSSHEFAGEVSAPSSPQAAAPSPASPAPGGATPADSSESRPELNAAGDGEVSPPPIPSGPDSAASEPNRKSAGAGAGGKGAGAAAGGSPAKGKPAPDNDDWFPAANRRARALAKKNLSADKDEAEAQRQALIWAASGGVSVASKDLTREQFQAMNQRLADLDEGRATLVETNDPTYLGWTLAYREVA